MTRTADDKHRAELLDSIVDYILANGYAGLSLRPLASAVKSSPRVLLYYFKSKDALLVEVISRARERQRTLFTVLKEQEAETAVDACRAIWSVMSSPAGEPAFRLFLEIYGHALQAPHRYAEFLRNAVGDWLSYIEAPYRRAGYSSREARALATIVLAGYRGFMLDLCATHDRARIDRAVDLWLESLNTLPSPSKLEEHNERPTAS